MKLILYFFQKTALHLAVEIGNITIVDTLFQNKKIDTIALLISIGF